MSIRWVEVCGWRVESVLVEGWKCVGGGWGVCGWRVESVWVGSVCMEGRECVGECVGGGWVVWMEDGKCRWREGSVWVEGGECVGGGWRV